MSHRGPDAAGLWIAEDGLAGLCHRRLSIIDLSDAANQPMASNDGRHVLVYNGEIYNYRDLARELQDRGHRFRTSSDTEVLLAAFGEWGEKCVERLDGMFAFAVWDVVGQTLFMARDRAGEKPLYYRESPGAIEFASELKALLRRAGAPRTLSPEALNNYLAYGYVATSDCLVAGYHKLPPGCCLTWRREGGVQFVRQYWSLPAQQPDPTDNSESLVEALEAKLASAVDRYLVADVPVGVLLSGGLDSSLVTALASRRAGGRIKTFNVSFPGHAGFDEAPYARLVAEHFGTEHQELVAEATNVGILPAIAAAFDEPLGDHAIVPMFQLSKQVTGEVKVALGGDGGDELFGGYPHHSFLQKGRSIRACIPRPLRIAIGGAASRLLAPGTRGRNHLIGFGGSGISQVNMYFDAYWRSQLLGPAVAEKAKSWSPEDWRRSLVPAGTDIVTSACAADFRSTLPEAYLVKVDRAAMAHSLEIRAPWLDRNLVEFAFREVPPQFKATVSQSKILPKLLARRLLPPALDIDRKRGLTMPLSAWYGGAWGPTVREIVSAIPAEIIEPRAVKRLLREQAKGRPNMQRLFALVMFELWRREYRIDCP